MGRLNKRCSGFVTASGKPSAAMLALLAFFCLYSSLNCLADHAQSLANWSPSARRIAALDLVMKAPGPEVSDA